MPEVWKTIALKDITPRKRRKQKKFGSPEEANIKQKAPTEAYGEQKAPVEAYGEQEATLETYIEQETLEEVQDKEISP